ncbi:MAG: penicillin-binding protein [Muribaculaceae bacterium]|nr:penicillin-binding protein [Muribaculaceae bacterium]
MSDKRHHSDNNDRNDILSNDMRRRASTQKIVRWLWGSFLGLGVVIAVLLLLIYNGVIGYMPPIEELEDPHSKLASVVYASDGTTELGRYFEGNANRVNNDYESVSPYVIDALISTEDVRFESHSGIDFMALGRTAVKTLMMGDKSSGGGSTITQQLAKQLYSQPSRNIFKRAMQKPIEWMIAIKLERFYTKEEIMGMYLNRFDFLNNAVGIKTAANVYFGKEPSALRAEEAAVLIGMLKNPSYYNPLRHPDRVRDRRNVVLDQMAKAGKLSQADADSLKQLPMEIDYHKVDFHEGGAPYFREAIRKMMTAHKPTKPNRSEYGSELAYNIAYGNYTTDSTQWENNPLYGWIDKNPKPDGSLYNLYTDGLRIYTTIDVKMQEYAEEAVNQHLGGTLQPAFASEKRGSPYGPYATPGVSTSQAKAYTEAAMKQTSRWRTMKDAGIPEEEIRRSFKEKYSMDVFAYVRENGKIRPGTKTMVMSPYDSLLYMKSILRTGLVSMDPTTGYVKAYVGGPDYTHFQYDMAGQGKRQIGSTVKPFLYTLAMEGEYTPCSTILNTQPRFGNWAPRNSGGGRVGQSVDLQWALTTSNNWISAKLIDNLRPANLVKKMRVFGITGYIEPSYPLCLGTADVSVKEMVSAYSAFSNHGLRVDPVFVTRIEDNQGNPIYSAMPHHEEVTNETAAANMVKMLMNVINNGTGRGLRGSYGISAEMGGKTGTTNSNSDAWFMGFTPDLVTGVWVGGEERTIRFNSMAFGQGAKAALPIYGIYMRKVYSDPKLPYKQDAKFDFPASFTYCGQTWTGGGGGEVEEEVEAVEGAFE